MLALSEAELVRAIASGSEEAACAFVEHFQGRIETILSKRSVPAGDRADISQEIQIDALRQIRDGRFRADSSLTTWIYTIVRGKTADYWRRQRLLTVSLETVDADHPSFALRSVTNDEVLAVQQALASLKPEEQMLLLMHDSEGYTLVEIGRMMDLRKSAVAKRLERARERFREAIGTGGNCGATRRLKE